MKIYKVSRHINVVVNHIFSESNLHLTGNYRELISFLFLCQLYLPENWKLGVSDKGIEVGQTLAWFLWKYMIDGLSDERRKKERERITLSSNWVSDKISYIPDQTLTGFLTQPPPSHLRNDLSFWAVLCSLESWLSSWCLLKMFLCNGIGVSVFRKIT